MMIPVVVRPEITADVNALPTVALRQEAIRFMLLLRSRPTLGQPLTAHPTIGDLSTCRKVYFDEGPGRRPRYRIVYRLLPSANNPTKVDLIAVGPRKDLSVYKVAFGRLS